jgi:hypothetical protein
MLCRNRPVRPNVRAADRHQRCGPPNRPRPGPACGARSGRTVRVGRQASRPISGGPPRRRTDQTQTSPQARMYVQECKKQHVKRDGGWGKKRREREMREWTRQELNRRGSRGARRAYKYAPWRTQSTTEREHKPKAGHKRGARRAAP